MIFVTVGAQLAFDRLVKTVDAWAAEHPDVECFAQVSESTFKLNHLSFIANLSPGEYQSYCRKADLIVAHAGMGSIITALEYGKPILIMPRRGDLKETRNDHQVATAKAFSGKPGIHVAMGESELLAKLDELLLSGNKHDAAPSHQVSPQLIQVLRDFVNQA